MDDKLDALLEENGLKLLSFIHNLEDKSSQFWEDLPIVGGL